MPHPDRLSQSTALRPRVSVVNLDAAKWLERLADDLALQEPCLARRIAAYRLAAAALRESPLRIEDLWGEGREAALTRIENVTPAIARVVGELFTTRRIALRRLDRVERVRRR